ncbi:MAG: BrnT family toxin [Burkholderiales bacterium]|nr:BrnT family toxin [Burkholderiales bacterium]
MFEWDPEKAQWDPEKARENEQRHGVSFAEATEVLLRRPGVLRLRSRSLCVGEERCLLFGMAKRGRALVVSYTERGERIRLISARQMTSRERRAYEQ